MATSTNHVVESVISVSKQHRDEAQAPAAILLVRHYA
jgi:hypothetical protein